MKRLAQWGASGLAGLYLFLYSPRNIQLPQQAAAQENGNCEQIVSEWRKKLVGWVPGIGNGCLDELDPEDAGTSGQRDNLICVKHFLEAYNVRTCGENSLYTASIEALVQHLFVKDETSRRQARLALQKTGFLNLQQQVGNLMDAAAKAERRVNTIKATYGSADEAEKEDLRREVRHWEMYGAEIQAQMVNAINRSLALREVPQPKGHPLFDDDLAEGMAESRQALDDLLKLSKDMERKNWSNVEEKIDDWKDNQKKVYDRLLGIMQQALDYGQWQVEKGTGRWVKIYYYDSEGKRVESYATTEFAEQWGKDGERDYYSSLKKMGAFLDKLKRFPEGITDEDSGKDSGKNSRLKTEHGLAGNAISFPSRISTTSTPRYQASPPHQQSCIPDGVAKGQREDIIRYFSLDPSQVSATYYDSDHWLIIESPDGNALYRQILPQLQRNFGRASLVGSQSEQSWWRDNDCISALLGFRKKAKISFE